MAGAVSEAIRRVVILGKTGAGKSSLGNTLLGQDVFLVERGMSSGTGKCQWAEAERMGTQLEVVDTPGLCDTSRSDEEVLKEISKSVALATPGPHAILMVLRCDRRFTEEEFYAYSCLKKLFGDDIKQFMIIVFVGMDALADTTEEQEACLKRELVSASEDMQTVLADAGRRYMGVNNRATREDRDRQADRLMHMIQGVVASNGGRDFTNKLCDDVTAIVEEMVQIKMRSLNLSHPRALKETKKDISDDKEGSSFWEKLFSRVGKALEIVVGIVTVVSFVKGSGAGGKLKKCSVM